MFTKTGLNISKLLSKAVLYFNVYFSTDFVAKRNFMRAIYWLIYLKILLFYFKDPFKHKELLVNEQIILIILYWKNYKKYI